MLFNILPINQTVKDNSPRGDTCAIAAEGGVPALPLGRSILLSAGCLLALGTCLKQAVQAAYLRNDLKWLFSFNIKLTT